MEEIQGNFSLLHVSRLMLLFFIEMSQHFLNGGAATRSVGHELIVTLLITTTNYYIHGIDYEGNLGPSLPLHYWVFKRSIQKS